MKIKALILSLALASLPAFAYDMDSDHHEGMHEHGHSAWHHGQEGLWMHHLGLSEEQKTQIKAIHAAHKDQWMAARKNLWSAKKALREATLKPESSSQDLQVLSQNVGNAAGQMAAVRAEVMQKTLAVLTPEQRAKLEKARDKHHHERG